MHTDIDKIIEELYAIDETLREHEASLRVLVTNLIESKPDVTVSSVFIEKLRSDLLWKAQGSIRAKTNSTPSPLSWWLIRLAPIGAFAVLMLILFPDPAGSPTPTPLYIQQNESFSTDATFKASAPAPSVDIKNPMVLESVSLDRAGFMVVRTSNGEILGVSKFLPSGTTAGVYINLSRVPNESEAVTTVFYPDNGDGVFSLNDLPVQ